MRVGFFSVGIGARPRRTLAGLRETEEKGLRPSQNCGSDSVKRILALVSLPEMPRLAGDAKWELSRQSLSFREYSSVQESWPTDMSSLPAVARTSGKNVAQLRDTIQPFWPKLGLRPTWLQ